MIQSTSRVLKEEVTFDEQQRHKPRLGELSDAALRRASGGGAGRGAALDEPSTGAGEEVMGATAAAIANAFFDATGVRLRQYPMTPERVRAALGAA